MIRFLRPTGGDRRRFTVWAGACAFSLLVALGVFASNGWLPRTDPFTGEKTGWFGRKLPKNHTGSAWNPIPPPSPTPQLSKEYIYAGSRLLAVEDANAQPAPPADIAVWRPSNGYWYVMGQAGSQATTQLYGAGGDQPVQGDYDADGKTDFAVWRPSNGNWYVWLAHPGALWGQSGDIPISGDFDGDGRTDFAVVRHGGGASLFYVLPAGGGSGGYGVEFGADTDVPAVADYDGDGRSDYAVFRPGNNTFYWLNSSDGSSGSAAMSQGGTVVSSDYDGDGRADPAVFDPSNASWQILSSATGTTTTTTWGSAGASGCTGGNCSGIRPVQNDYDLDGKTDLAVWDNASSATWKIKKSSDGSTRTETWGATGDIPVPAFYRR